MVTRWGQIRARPPKSLAPGGTGSGKGRALRPDWAMRARRNRVVHRPGGLEARVSHLAVEKSSPGLWKIESPAGLLRAPLLPPWSA